MPANTLSARQLYQSVLECRIAEQRLNELSQTGEIGAGHSGLNHEGVGVGIGTAVGIDDYVQTSYRSGASTMHARGGLTLEDLVFQGFGLLPGPRVQHPGGPKTIRSTGILGGQVPTALGIAYSFVLRNDPHVVVTVLGDGAFNEGAISESLNIAGVKRLPIVFVVENNGIALSASFRESTAAYTLAARGLGFGIPAVTIDGSDAVAVNEAVAAAASRARRDEGPSLIEAKITRPAGHATTLHESRSAAQLAQTLTVDAVESTRARAVDAGELTDADDEALITETRSRVEAAIEVARSRVAEQAKSAVTAAPARMTDAEAWRAAHVSEPPAWMEGARRAQ